MDALGLIFSNIHSKENFEITEKRTIASTPIGGKYRLIDFTLSNMVNAGITSVGVVTKSNYQSLMDHVGSGKEWDLARKNGGLVILAPFSNTNQVYNTRLEALKSISSFIRHAKEEYVLLSDCYHVCNIDYQDVFDFHIKNNADITCVYNKRELSHEEYFPINKFTIDDNNRVTHMDSVHERIEGSILASMDIWIMKRQLLIDFINETLNTNFHSFNRDILARNLNNLKVYGYEFKGYFGNISSLNSYYKVSNDFIKEDVRNELFYQDGRGIYTKVRDSAPTKYGSNAIVSNSLIADGCEINGIVENSIIFRGVKIKKGAVVKNSILLQSTTVEEGINIDYVITDKNVTIKSKKEFKGSKDNLVYVKKGGVI